VFRGHPILLRTIKIKRRVTPNRRHAVKGRDHFAFSDVRRLVAKAAMDENFVIPCPVQGTSVINSLVSAFLRMAA